MNNKRNENDWNGNMEDWLKDFFLDPLTTFLDEAEFRIDVFETDNHYIVEALLPTCQKEDIQVLAEEKILTILAKCLIDCKMEKKQRHVSFPFAIDRKEMAAILHGDILEISISKYAARLKCQKNIPVK